MRIWFRDGFYVGLALALLLGIYLIWLWGAEHQVRRHTDNLLVALEHKDWKRFATFISADYRDQWGHDREAVSEKTRLVFSYVRGARVVPGFATVQIDGTRGWWHAQIRIEGEGEMTELLKERVNSLATPFELEWHRMSSKPWDWKLVRVTNPSLEIPREMTGY
jgi:hypothetical protein